MSFIENKAAFDPIKELGERALAAGRHFQSRQTGYIHLFYGEAEQHAQTIPLMENFLFVLALFRTRIVEQIQEGKKILKGLLVFQNRTKGNDEGNFPLYLHEYPACFDPALSLNLLAPMYWIEKQFGYILGPDLRHQLDEAIHLALNHAVKAHHQKHFPYWLGVRLAAAKIAFGELWQEEVMIAAGNRELTQLSDHQLNGWSTSQHLADILVGLQMVGSDLSQTPWNHVWDMLGKMWHAPLAAYAGPHVREWQNGEEPQVNLLDLFGGYFGGCFSHRVSQLKPVNLYGVLIQPAKDKFGATANPILAEGMLKNQRWQIYKTSSWAYCALEKNGPYQPAVDQTHTPFRFIWGDKQQFHTMVCQGGNIENVAFHAHDDLLVLDFILRDVPQEKQYFPKNEIEFFIDYHSELKILFDGSSATTFELGQEIQLHAGSLQLDIRFELLEGEGTFLGHLMRGNRPSQTDLKGDKRFLAYDWTFFLRTIRRQSYCKVRSVITLPKTLTT